MLQISIRRIGRYLVCSVLAAAGLIASFCVQAQSGSAADYQFRDGKITRPVLENYLSRSITMAELCNGQAFLTDGAYPDREDDVRMLRNIGAKFIGRAVYSWGSEQRFADPGFWQEAEKSIDRLHALDKDLVFQACIFEIITTRVAEVPVPGWVFKEFQMEETERNFNYQAMINPDGKLNDHWRQGASVPDISRVETQMWFYFLAKKYIDIGVEALHFGQLELMAMQDREQNFSSWWSVIDRIRDYAASHARRGMVLCDAHVPGGGIVREGELLLDFHSFPLRPKDVADKPQEAVLTLDYMDSFYRRSRGGITPSGWACESLPYLVEVDNYGVSKQPGQPDQEWFVWGYDEISWFAIQPESYRNEWLRYAWNWVKKHDPSGFLQMPGSRVISGVPAEKGRRYRANTKSSACPMGFSQEETIKSIWAE